MKKVLIAAAVLLVIGVLLDYSIGLVFQTNVPAGLSLQIAEWRDYNVSDSYEVSVFPDNLVIDAAPAPGQRTPTRYEHKGRWLHRAFYCDSPQDSSTMVLVAREIPNEDLEVDISYFVPTSHSKLYCAKVFRGNLDDYHPYPTTQDPAYQGKPVSYPPPKGLIRVGMVEADLASLPWNASVIESHEDIYPYDRENAPYLENIENADSYPPQVYHYHSDDPHLSELLVTVYHGHVTDVSGGREDTDDTPWLVPPPPPPQPPAPDTIPKSEADDAKPSWALWLFDLLFTKPTHSD